MVPNLFTVGNMVLGFFAIVATLDGRWFAAPIAIFVAHIFDILDGRLARWMGHESKFGGEFDSFADWISFGLAPALMVYVYFLSHHGKLGFLLAFFYVFAGAFRLARFNVKMSEDHDGPSQNFTGLPIPGAGGFLAILVLLNGLAVNGSQGKTLDVLYRLAPRLDEAMAVIVFSLSLLLISKIQYSTFKRMRLLRPRSLRSFLILLFVCFMIYAYPQNTIFILYAGYILWGLINTAWSAYTIRRSTRRNSP